MESNQGRHATMVRFKIENLFARSNTFKMGGAHHKVRFLALTDAPSKLG